MIGEMIREFIKRHIIDDVPAEMIACMDCRRLLCPNDEYACRAVSERMHGGASTGPRTPEGLRRIAKARTVHGGYSAEARELRRLKWGARRSSRYRGYTCTA